MKSINDLILLKKLLLIMIGLTVFQVVFHLIGWIFSSVIIVQNYQDSNPDNDELPLLFILFGSQFVGIFSVNLIVQFILVIFGILLFIHRNISPKIYRNQFLIICLVAFFEIAPVLSLIVGIALFSISLNLVLSLRNVLNSQSPVEENSNLL